MEEKNKEVKFALGTAQFGLQYGINNKTGKPSRKTALSILMEAFKQGIRVFDTAYVYGDAEDILGEFMKNKNISREILIISKFKPYVFSRKGGDINKIMKKEVQKSLTRLGRDYLDGYLLHTPECIYDHDIVGALVSLKRAGYVRNIGVSIYEETEALYALKLGLFDYIQAPYSIFDQRLDRISFFRLAKERGITVFTRSAFLQGLMLMKEDDIPEYLREARQFLRRLDGILLNYQLTRLEAALLFSYNNPYIDYVVLGVDTKQQLKENINIVENQQENIACLQELRDNFSDIEKKIISPNLWKKEN